MSGLLSKLGFWLEVFPRGNTYSPEKLLNTAGKKL
jgi:hypothetical protein